MEVKNEANKSPSTSFPGPDKVQETAPERGLNKMPDHLSFSPIDNNKADEVIRKTANLSEPTKNKAPIVGDIVLLNLIPPQVRPALVVNINEDYSLDLCVFFNGPKDFIITGHTEPTTWYSSVIAGEDEGQWKRRV